MYCPKCGAQVNDTDTFCPQCGAKLREDVLKGEVVSEPKKKDNILAMLAFIFCLISTIVTGFALIPLIWMIPLTVGVYNYYKGERTLGIGYKVCVLIFVSIIGGIFLLVDEVDQ